MIPIRIIVSINININSNCHPYCFLLKVMIRSEYKSQPNSRKHAFPQHSFKEQQHGENQQIIEKNSSSLLLSTICYK